MEYSIRCWLVEQLQVLQASFMKVDMDELVSAATTTELASEIYAVSIIAINVAERNYLTMLSTRLRLPKELSSAIDREIEQQAA